MHHSTLCIFYNLQNFRFNRSQPRLIDSCPLRLARSPARGLSEKSGKTHCCVSGGAADIPAAGKVASRLIPNRHVLQH